MIFLTKILSFFKSISNFTLNYMGKSVTLAFRQPNTSVFQVDQKKYCENIINLID